MSVETITKEPKEASVPKLTYFIDNAADAVTLSDQLLSSTKTWLELYKAKHVPESVSAQFLGTMINRVVFEQQSRAVESGLAAVALYEARLA